MNKIFIIILLLCVILIWGSQCAASHEEESEKHLPEKISAFQNPIFYDIDDTKMMGTDALQKVHAKIPGVAAFFTPKRTAQIMAFPCSNCHTEPLSDLQANRSENQRNGHWDIHLHHAGAEVMDCTTCHAIDKMDMLKMLSGELLHFDESFKLCGQCHSTEFKDWQGGAHGKELNGWTPPRVAKTCVGCHNPHKPSFESRLPARHNTKDLIYKQ